MRCIARWPDGLRMPCSSLWRCGRSSTSSVSVGLQMQTLDRVIHCDRRDEPALAAGEQHAVKLLHKIPGLATQRLTTLRWEQQPDPTCEAEQHLRAQSGSERWYDRAAYPWVQPSLRLRRYVEPRLMACKAPAGSYPAGRYSEPFARSVDDMVRATGARAGRQQRRRRAFPSGSRLRSHCSERPVSIRQWGRRRRFGPSSTFLAIAQPIGSRRHW